ncbi:interleukin-17C [Bufo bufo]|uniref:interleukin-17C n=1 Tax=Bufo bufo TaxID=8384 RepID=UPI001ABE40D1|nr:interleukin-17C [Bufo bufo]
MSTLWVVLLLAVWSINICCAKHAKHRNQNHNQDSVYCFSEEELENTPSKVLHHFVSSKMHWERYSAVNLVSTLEENESRRKRRRRTPQPTCHMSTLKKGHALNERSISPWTYRIDTDESRYPQKLAFAHCLCEHCISSESGKETSSLNSVQVKQTMLVLRKKRCLDTAKFTFELEYISVPVACTCSVPRY